MILLERRNTGSRKKDKTAADFENNPFSIKHIENTITVKDINQTLS